MIAKLFVAVSLVLALYAPAPARVEAPAPAGEPAEVQAAPTIEPPEMLWPIMRADDDPVTPAPPTSTPPPNAYP